MVNSEVRKYENIMDGLPFERMGHLKNINLFAFKSVPA